MHEVETSSDIISKYSTLHSLLEYGSFTEKYEAEDEKWRRVEFARFTRATREISYLTSLPTLIESSRNTLQNLNLAGLPWWSIG